VVNGIIDELSYVCPDKDLEESFDKPGKNEPPPNQPTIAEFVTRAGGFTLESPRNKRRFRDNKIYLCDVKTRSVRTLPSEMAFRPAKMQLMLYHKLLSMLATNNVDLAVLTERFKLDPSKVFSDSFIAQVGSLNDDAFYDASSEPPDSQESITQWSQDSMTILLEHNTISQLWALMISEFQITLPDGAASLSQILKAEYRSRSTGEVVGSKTFVMDKQELQAYIEKEMQWWRGEREAQGVVIEEAFKCRSCDFAEDCEWRLKKVDEAKEKMRMTKRRTAVV
jgi:exonuclease V